MVRENGYPEHIWRAGRAGLLAKWAAFVDDVERGYKLGLEDYRNDLDLRAIIALAGLEADARFDDERLRRMLTATGKRVWESSPGNPFWDFGYPKNASGELLEDLKAGGWRTSHRGAVPCCRNCHGADDNHAIVDAVIDFESVSLKQRRLESSRRESTSVSRARK